MYSKIHYSGSDGSVPKIAAELLLARARALSLSLSLSLYIYIYIYIHTHTHTYGARRSVVVKALCYKPEGRGFETR
jgi:hypothetical protein